MTIRVAMIADYPESEDRIDGGVQAVTSDLVAHLARNPQIDLHVIDFAANAARARKTQKDNWVWHMIPSYRWGTLTGFARDQASLNACLASIAPDIVHSQGGGRRGALAKRAGYPTVVTIHGIATQEAKHQSGIWRRTRTRIQGWIGDYHCIRRATHTILVSPYVAKHYGARLAGKQHLIPNPVDERFFDVVRREEPDKVLFAGRLYALKGVTSLVRAIAQVAKSNAVRLVLAGSLADRSYVRELLTEARALGVADLIEFRGILSKDELLREFSTCACLVLPSSQETAPMVIQEAMASGVPVIASSVGGIPYQVENGTTGYLVRPGEVGMLSDRLMTLLENRQLRCAFGEAAKRLAERHYRSAAIASSTFEVYREMLDLSGTINAL